MAQGIVDVGDGKLADGARDFSQALSSARASGDRFVQAQALLNLGVIALRQEHYDNALDLLGQASAAAKAIGARQTLEKAAGSVGSAFYKVGDFHRALANASIAEQQAVALGSPIDQVAWLRDAGLSQFRLGDLAAARSSYQASLALARTLQNDDDTVDALTALAWLSLRAGDMAGALDRSREAQRLAARSGDQAAGLQPSLIEALVFAGRGEASEAEKKLLGLEASVSVKQSVRWEIQHSLAQLYAHAGDAARADAFFRRAIATFREQRSSVSNLDSRLPFFENGSSLYLDYMEYLISAGRTDDALLVLDQSRAETLAEGLHVAVNQTASPAGRAHATRVQAAGSSSAPGQAIPVQVRDPYTIARQLRGTILVYCLQPGTSYLWAIGPHGRIPGKNAFFRLPGKDGIEPLLASHTRAILSSKDLLSQPDAPGLALYRLLVEPARAVIDPRGKVFIVAGEGLDGLNFETLIAPTAGSSDTQAHFWVEDADILNARSVSLLGAGLSATGLQQPGATSKRLLLVGDPVYDRAEYGKLPHASEEVALVTQHFAPDRRLVLTGAQATPAAFQVSQPGSYAYIHFVAHGTASEMNPLDSSVILSSRPGEADSAKLYARRILEQRLHADLVIISACYGSGVRSYSGEGLVGLAWAFLRAGSHNVVGALWEVSDASTPQLMSDLYEGLAHNSSPDQALRSAKLAMLHRGGVFRKPFYWAAFQLYSGA